MKLIDADNFKRYIIETYHDPIIVCNDEVHFVAEIIDDYHQTVEAIPKGQYEARLKADLVAMLTELQLEIEEKSIIDYDEDLYDGGECVISISEINEIIQEKINKLKAESEDNNETM